MIIYEIRKNKYYKNNKCVSKKSVLSELKNYQINKLNQNKICRVREVKEQLVKQQETYQDSKIDKVIDKNVKPKLKQRELKILEKVKNDYRTSQTIYRTLGLKYELWRKNPKGYYNFARYLDSLDENHINEAILADVKEQKKLAKEAREKKELF